MEHALKDERRQVESQQDEIGQLKQEMAEKLELSEALRQRNRVATPFIHAFRLLADPQHTTSYTQALEPQIETVRARILEHSGSHPFLSLPIIILI